MEKEILSSLENESFVSLDVAELLKKNGFNLQCRNFYRKEDGEWFRRTTYEHNYFNTDVPRWEGCYACPTHQMVLKWLREVHGIFIGVSLCKRYENTMDDDTKIMFFFELLNLKEKYPIDVYSQEYVHTYEEAVEAAIKYCLTNLIK